jgi:hypothetical protein
MKKLHVMMLALVAMFAFSALLAEVASAEITLLAEWLANGATITTTLTSETSGKLRLEDAETIAGKSAVICSAILDGTIGPNGEDSITEILNLAGQKIELGLRALLGTGNKLPDCEGTGMGCAEGTAASPIEVYPLGLPWKTLLFLMENGEFLDAIFAAKIGYEILCLLLGINAEDTCEASQETALIQNSPETGDAFTPSGSKITPNAKCTQSGGKETGINEASGPSTMTLGSGELLTISSE